MVQQALLEGSSFTGRAVAFRPAQAQPARRGALCVQAKESRIGKKPILLPSNVELKFDGQSVSVKGPLGVLDATFSPLIDIKQEDGKLRLYKTVDTRKADELHGLTRALLNNMILGTSEGWTKTLSLVGVGYRAAVKDDYLVLNLGFSHPVEMEIPEGLQVKVTKNTTIDVTGRDKEAVGQFCAKVRSKRPPEPYKGKGVRLVDEVVRRKEGKRGK